MDDTDMNLWGEMDGWLRERKLNIWPDEGWTDEEKQQQMGKGEGGSITVPTRSSENKWNWDPIWATHCVFFLDGGQWSSERTKRIKQRSSPRSSVWATLRLPAAFEVCILEFEVQCCHLLELQQHVYTNQQAEEFIPAGLASFKRPQTSSLCTHRTGKKCEWMWSTLTWFAADVFPSSEKSAFLLVSFPF